MEKLRLLWAMSWSERLLLVYSIWMLACTRLALCLVPFYKVRHFIERHVPDGHAAAGSHRPAPGQLTWALSMAARLVPQATCLALALSCHSMLKHYGYPSLMHVGVQVGRDSHLQYHAWVESCGKIVVGDDGRLYDYREIIPTADISGYN